MDSKSVLFLTHQSFFSAVRSGDLAALSRVVEKLAKDEPASNGSLVSDLMAMQNDAGETALYMAAYNNLEEVFGYLLKFCGVEVVKIRSKLDMNAFHVAAKRGHLGIVKALLGIWPELCKLCDSSNTSPLYSAAVQDHLDVVSAILDADISSVRIVRKNGKTALHTAARYGLLRIAKALIERDRGIVCIKDKKGQTALHMAVKGQCTPVVEEILDADTSILNERDKKGNTAVHIATRKCRPQITLVAWETGAQKQVVSVVNKLMWAACACTCGAFLSIAFVVVGEGSSWMATAITVVGVPILIGTLASMCYFVFRHHFGAFQRDSQRRMKRASGSKSFSWSFYSANISDLDDEYNSDHEKIYAL